MSTAQIWQLGILGFLLGWSVAWPPGPINAEILRRALTRGFWPASAVGYGASTGDAIWALVVAVGAGAVIAVPGAAAFLSVLSKTLLTLLAAHYLWTAWRNFHGPRAAGRAIESTRAGYLFGLIGALASPFNIGFWIAVMGRPELAGLGLGAALIIALAVIGGTVTWVTLFAGAAAAMQRYLTHPLWDVVTRVVTAIFLLAFAYL